MWYAMIIAPIVLAILIAVVVHLINAFDEYGAL